MNLSDLKEQTLLLEKDLKNVSEVIELLAKIKEENESWANNMIDTILNYEIVGAANTSIVNNASKVQQITKAYFKDFIQSLKNIEFSDSIFSLAKLENKYDCVDLRLFIIKFRECYKSVHKFIQISDDTNSSANIFLHTYKTINNIVYEFRLIQYAIKEIDEIQSKLVAGSDEYSLKIRLLKEDNNVSSLIENIEIIKSLYDIMNKIIGDEGQELRYRRAESGTFEIDLTGCATTLSALLPTLTFMYKIYSENFSWKAKQDKELGEIKVRGELIKLVRAFGELNPKEQDLVQKYFGELELKGRKLFINNPAIKLNDEKIGLEEEIIKNISKEYIESNIPRIEEKEITLDEETTTEDKEAIQE